MIPRSSTSFFAFFVFGLVSLVLITACATSPTGRRQLMLFQESEMDQMGVAAFTEIKGKTKATQDAGATRYVRCVANSITQVLDNTKKSHAGNPGNWEVVVFEDNSANAFALPGRKIGVHTGLLKVATNQDQLAAVIGHEIAHVLSGHSNERLSTAYATESGLQVLASLSNSGSQGQSQIIALLGAGAQVGILLPFSRAQESESDVLGAELMAKAGFDPRQSIELWKNMSKAGDGGSIELLSTHPSNSTRMQALEAELPRTMPLYEKARAQGRRPNCTR